ncbi:MAG TPA: hypothetical protein VGO27_00890, partial [Candidatus Acidoferrum sp.]|nr:hypothetical protein [Candidatus Acidoferrum sp.]
PFEEAMLAPPRPVEPPREVAIEPAPSAAQDNTPALAAVEPAPAAAPVPEPSPPAPPTPAPAPPPPESPTVTAAPLFRSRQDIPKLAPSRIPVVIPIVRAPDDPGIDDESGNDEFAEQIGSAQGQAGGWRGFLSRWGG